MNSYWTIKFGGPLPVGMEPNLPHERLGNFQSATAKGLMAILRKRGRKPAEFADSDNKFVKIRHSDNGFNVSYFSSYRSACAADSGMQKADYVIAGSLKNLMK